MSSEQNCVSDALSKLIADTTKYVRFDNLNYTSDEKVHISQAVLNLARAAKLNATVRHWEDCGGD